MNLRYLAMAGFLFVASLGYAQVEEQVEIAVPVEAVPLPPPPPPTAPPKRKKWDTMSISMPRFANEACEKLPKHEVNPCAQEEMLKFVYSNLQYPQVAKDSLVEGTVVINFVVLHDGTISETKIVRDIDGGCGEEALRIVNSMPKWVPGMQDGEVVASYFNLPVKFKLDKIKEEE